MTKKNLWFCSFFVALMSACSVAFAADMLREEDENLIYNKSDKEAEDVVFIEPVQPIKGPGLQSIQVPDEINAKAIMYAEPEQIIVRPDTPRSVIYPIGKERKERDAWKYEWYDPQFAKSQLESNVNAFHEGKVKAYKADVEACKEQYEQEIDIEMSTLSSGDKFTNAKYLSQTFSNMYQCLDDVGLNVIDYFYDGQNDMLRAYNNKVETFHVKSDDVNFDVKYCKDTCSFEAVAELQLEKFDQFKSYLFELIENAPVKEDVPEINEEDDLTYDVDFIESDDDYVYEKDGVVYIDE